MQTLNDQKHAVNRKIPNTLAPIGVSTYARLQHLQSTIAALQKNELAHQSELYIFSDAPKPGDEERVAAVRDYLSTITGFKKIHITKRNSNDRVANSRGGLKMLLDKFGKVIFFPEDTVTAPGFLTFMNQALEKYKDNKKIFSIAGYCPPIKIPTNYKHDVFLLKRFTAWGFGIWKDRFDQLKYMTPGEYEEFAANKKWVREFKAGGKDLMTLLKLDAYGKIDAGDVKLMYAQFLSNQFTVYPIQSLVQNTGNDGTGEHCGKTNRFNVALNNKTTFLFPNKPIVDSRLVKSNRIFRDGSAYDHLRARVINIIPQNIKQRVPRAIKQLFQSK